MRCLAAKLLDYGMLSHCNFSHIWAISQFLGFETHCPLMLGCRRVNTDKRLGEAYSYLSQDFNASERRFRSLRDSWIADQYQYSFITVGGLAVFKSLKSLSWPGLKHAEYMFLGLACMIA